jgi:hypothetical protein
MRAPSNCNPHFSYHIIVLFLVFFGARVLILFQAGVTLADDPFDLRKFASLLLNTHPDAKIGVSLKNPMKLVSLQVNFGVSPQKLIILGCGYNQTVYQN